MGVFIQGNGRKIKHVVMGNQLIMMVMFMKVNGQTTKRTATAFICIQMVQNTRDIERMISRTDKVRKYGQMEQIIKDSTKMEKNQEKEFYISWMAPSTMDSLKIIKFKVKVSIFDLMEKFIGVQFNNNNQNRQWYQNKMNGEGKLTWEDGRYYEGGYQNDKKQGIGMFLWQDGRKYYGYWKDGKQNGVGIYISVNGEKRYGEWIDGKRKQWISEELFIKMKGELNFNFF